MMEICSPPMVGENHIKYIIDRRRGVVYHLSEALKINNNKSTLGKIYDLQDFENLMRVLKIPIKEEIDHSKNKEYLYDWGSGPAV